MVVISPGQCQLDKGICDTHLCLGLLLLGGKRHYPSPIESGRLI